MLSHGESKPENEANLREKPGQEVERTGPLIMLFEHLDPTIPEACRKIYLWIFQLHELINSFPLFKPVWVWFPLLTNESSGEHSSPGCGPLPSGKNLGDSL